MLYEDVFAISKGPVIYEVSNRLVSRRVVDINNLPKSPSLKTIIDPSELTSNTDTTFGVILLESGLFHSMADDMTTTYAANEIIPNLKLVCIVSTMLDEKICDMFKSFFDFYNIDATFFYVKETQNTGVLLNDAVNLSHNVKRAIPVSFHQHLSYVRKWALASYRSIDTKKYPSHVYLSRRAVGERPFTSPIPPDHEQMTIFNRTSDIRLVNEHLLEEYLGSIGFAIISPEELEDVNEQISIMKNAKVLMSATSSGLSNMMFMEPGSMVVELSISFINPGANLSGNNVYHVHSFYYEMAYSCGHTYMSLNNSTAQAEDMIAKIENNQSLKNLLAGES